MDKTFTLEYWRDGDWFVGRLKEVPGVFSQGKTLEELEENVREVYALMSRLEARRIRSDFEGGRVRVGAAREETRHIP
jgi:predicted RNase H-like HicB family nuclease